MEEEYVRVRMPQGAETIGVIVSLLGANKLRVKCQDGKLRLCRIPGKMRKRVWMRENDAVIVKPWDIKGDDHGDVIWKYTPPQKEHLIRKGLLD